MNFEEYNGWANKPTWNLSLCLGNSYETYQHAGALVNAEGDTEEQAIESLQNWLSKAIGSWYLGVQFTHTEAISCWMSDSIKSSAYWVAWTTVLDSLEEGRDALGEGADEITVAAFDFYRAGDWQSVIAGHQWKTQADEMLREYLADRILDWIEQVEMRMQQGPLQQYCQIARGLWFGAINWQEIVGHWREEQKEEGEE
jgi:hypothetical protein